MRIDRTRVQERAEKLARQGKIPAALAEFRLLLKDQPNDINTLNRAGDLLARTGNSEEAIELFDRLAHLYTLGGFFHKAIAIYRKILKLDPKVVEPRLRLADLYARRDLTTEARGEYRAVAERLIRAGDESRAREVYEKLVRMEPASVAVRTVLGDIYLAMGNVTRAVGEMRAAARDMEGLGLAEESRAIHKQILAVEGVELETAADSVGGLARLGDSAGAIQAAEALRLRFPEEKAATEVLVEALDLSGRHEDAEDLVRSDLGGDAEGAIARIVVGRLHAKAGRREEAVTVLLAAARDLWGARRPGDAAVALDTLLEIDSSQKDALQLRLEIARALEDSDTVSGVSDRLVSDFGEDPGDPVVRDIAPQDPTSVADLAAAADLGRTLTREEKDFLAEHMTEAEVFVKYGLHEKAIEPLQMVLSRFPAHLEAHVRMKGIYADQGNRGRVVIECLAIAELHERAGRREEAIKMLSEAKSIEPENPVVRGRLERLQGTTKRTPRQAMEPRAPVRPEELEISVEDEDAGSFAAAQEPDGSPPAPASEERPESLEGTGLVRAGGDLARTLEAVLDQEAAESEPSTEGQDLGEVLKVFQQRVSEQVESTDYKTHYELGIAYKEMGLLDEAVSELEYAAADRTHFIECCAMLALCFRQKDAPDEARDWYLKGIRSGLGADEQRLGLQFELAETYIEIGDFNRAREEFRQVAKIDRTYRDVADRLREIEGLA